jgi:hypothetical protein
MPRLQDTDESLTNEFDATLAEIKQVSPALRNLLSECVPDNYSSEVEADKATVAKSRYWRFIEGDICEILKQHRARQRDSDSIHELIQETTLTEVDPVPRSLGSALIERAKRNNGRPEAGVATLREIQAVFDIIGDKSTAREIAETGFSERDATDISSVKRRVQRGLQILERAGYVSHKEVGQLYVWYDEGLSSLSLPTHLHTENRNL